MTTATGEQRPKILQCISMLDLGGAERVALTLIDALRSDFDFVLHAVRGRGRGEIARALESEVRGLGIPLFFGPAVPMRFGGVLTSAVQLRRVVTRTRPDVLHLHTEIPEAAYAGMRVFSRSLDSARVVRTVHNVVYWDFSRSFARWCDRRMGASAVAGVSTGATDAFLRLREESGAGEPPIKPLTICNGVVPPRSSKVTRDNARSRPLKIVFAGRLEEQKGSDLLPTILHSVRPPEEGAHLTILGSGIHEGLLRELASRPPVGWQVSVLPPIPRLADHLQEYDLVIMPSRYEGRALLAIEAALAAVPVIASNISGLADCFPATHPWIAAPGDGRAFATVLQQAVDAPERWSEVASAARLYAKEHFSVETMADAYRTLYRKLLEGTLGTLNRKR